MIEALLIKALLPVVAGNAQGVITWFFSKRRKDEKFSPEKMARTAFAGLVVAGIAWGLGLPVDEQHLVTVAAESAAAVNLLEQLIFKRLWDKFVTK